MHILIIEDEKRNFNRLKRLLEEIDGTFRIDGPLASIVEAVEWLQAHPAPELIFADIRLSDGLSFDVLRRTAVPSPVIFTTAYDEYAIQAFKYNSFDYLLKPVKADELAAAMVKCAAQVPRRQTAKRCASYWNICGKAITVIASVFFCLTATAIFPCR